MSSTILVSGTASNAGLPVDGDLRVQLSSNTHTRDWLQMDPSTCTITSGAVTSCNSIGANASVYSTTLAGAPIAEQSTYNGYPAVTLSGAGAQMLKGPRLSELDDDFSILVFVARPANITSSAFWFVQRSATDGKHTSVGYGADGSIQAFHRGTGITIAPAGTDSVPRLIIMSYSESLLRLRGDTTDQDIVSASASGTETSYENASYIWGQSSAFPSGTGSDVVILNTDIFAAGNEDLLADWTAYFDEVYL